MIQLMVHSRNRLLEAYKENSVRSDVLEHLIQNWHDDFLASLEDGEAHRSGIKVVGVVFRSKL